MRWCCDVVTVWAHGSLCATCETPFVKLLHNCPDTRCTFKYSAETLWDRASVHCSSCHTFKCKQVDIQHHSELQAPITTLTYITEYVSEMYFASSPCLIGFDLVERWCDGNVRNQATWVRSRLQVHCHLPVVTDSRRPHSGADGYYPSVPGPGARQADRYRSESGFGPSATSSIHPHVGYMSYTLA